MWRPLDNVAGALLFVPDLSFSSLSWKESQMSSDGKADDLAARIGLGSVLLVLLGMFAFVAVDGYRITSTSSVHCVTV